MLAMLALFFAGVALFAGVGLYGVLDSVIRNEWRMLSASHSVFSAVMVAA
jgi:hypothetical protein